MPESRNCFAIFEDAGIPLDGHGMVGKEAGKAFTDQLVAESDSTGRGHEPRRSWLLPCSRPDRRGQSLTCHNPIGPFGTARCRAPLRIP